MEGLLRSPVLTVLWKDLVLESRTKDFFVSVLVFAIIVIVVFNFAVDPTPQTVGTVAPGILWVAIVFGGVLGLTRSFALEKERGAINGLLLAPVGRDSIYFGKMLASFLFMFLVEAVTFPIFAVIFNIPLSAPGFLPVAVLTTVGIAAVGTLFSAMAVNTKAREVMLPLLFLPVALPAIVAAVEATAPALAGGGWGAGTRWLPFLAGFDALFIVVCAIAFAFVVED
ncbi:MAG: heme ABC transporter permease CcmB [SAR202 cluster bacterium]|nr:heme ABC transporter permease CcmB [SAR202 cluster bacterium]